MIDWERAKILDRESERRARQVREAIWIRKRRNVCINRDEGSYILPHVYDRVIAAPSSGDQV